MDFETFYFHIKGHKPFKWQNELSDRILNSNPESIEWPDACDIPTGCGKTSLMAIAVHAMAYHPRPHRRIVHLIDRRIVVDDADSFARDIQSAIEHNPALRTFKDDLWKNLQLHETDRFRVMKMRGGSNESFDNISSPVEPCIITGTASMIGSRLLFRGYRVSKKMRSVYAGLLAYDTLHILDEIHLSRPLRDTYRQIKKSVQSTKVPGMLPMSVVEMSATIDPSDSGQSVFSLGTPCDALKPRIDASKCVTIESDGTPKFVASAVKKAMIMGYMKIGVIVNTVTRARQIFQDIQALQKDCDMSSLLFIGPIRPYDRDRLYRRPELQALYSSSKPYDRPIVAVATQTIEVGADFDFDYLISDVAPIDTLQQRFGRMNRTGSLKTHAAAGMILCGSSIKDGYGDPQEQTRNFLMSIPDKKIDFGIAAMRNRKKEDPLLAGTSLQSMVATSTYGDLLVGVHERILAKTSITPEFDIDIETFVHGATNGRDISVVWRKMPEDRSEWANEIMAAPPCSDETIEIPMYALIAFLQKAKTPLDFSDAPNSHSLTNRTDKQLGEENRPFIQWRYQKNPSSGDDNFDDGVGVASLSYQTKDIRMGDTIVLPQEYGGCDAFGWNGCLNLQDFPIVSDLSELAYATTDSAGEIDRSRIRVPFVLQEEINDDEDDDVLDRASINAIATQGAMYRLSHLSDMQNQEDSAKIEKIIISIIQTLGRKKQRDKNVFIRRASSDAVWITVRHQYIENDEDDALSSIGRKVSLADHSQHVSERASDFVARLGGLSFVDEFAIAGKYHDLGKIDPQFQSQLYGNEPVDPHCILAKSGKKYRPWTPIVRHEAISIAIMWDRMTPLSRHLIGTHHGWGRPHFPNRIDRRNLHGQYTIPFHDGEETFDIVSADGLIERGWEDQMVRLHDTYGVWGLAYLEAIFRLADFRCSHEESKGPQ